MEVLISEARRRHALGTAPGRIFAELAVFADPREAAVAVCVALGIARAEAERSVGAPGQNPEFWDLTGYARLSRLEAAHEIGGLLEGVGVFHTPNRR
ncbi:hypothetical protein [Saccharothrix variisporea]|uniref:Uncharacterized protein n=1 Tax=Saccharothrix variisporea TaxID=543527 RepID=A0A495XIB0_9PSEU|nr:hypothetical protein [Saccharothrix variisporea]RKT72504.1 hypothetical protein DFJ66_5818 [Saccharothrix variisporea]